MKHTTKHDSGAALYILKFIVFSLVFLAIGLAVCALWAFIGKTASITGSLPAAATSKPVVIIDAGHGGADGGAVGLSQMPEKELNLNIALMLRDMLTAAGIDVVMTRTEDIMLTADGTSSKKAGDLLARRNIAEATPEAVFVSIHMNSFPIEKYSGLQVYYSPNNENSIKLANVIQDSVHEYIQPENSRKTKQATESIYLLHHLNCPAVLIESGFLSNQAEAEMLNTVEYRKQLAYIICCAVCEHLAQ